MKLNEVIEERITLRGIIRLSDLNVESLSIIDVDGKVDLTLKKLEKIPAKFGKVSGKFDCRSNKLTSLEGCPTHANDFNASRNELTSLKGCHLSKVEESFCVSENKLTSLKGSPTSVGLIFSCSNNYVTSLEGSPKYIGFDFSCRKNKLISLDYSPETIGRDFICAENQIHSLEGIHKSIKKIGRVFDCSHNPITSGGIGLILIEDLSSINAKNCMDFTKAAEIINKYLGKGKTGLLDCQEELEEASLEQYAKL